jgi:hypothetical protein
MVGTPPYASEGFAYAAPLGALGAAGGLAAYLALLGLRASTKQGNGWNLVRRVLGMTVAVPSLVGVLVLGGWLAIRIYEGLTGNVVRM